MESPRKDHTDWTRGALIGLRDGAEGSTSLGADRLDVASLDVAKSRRG